MFHLSTLLSKIVKSISHYKFLKKVTLWKSNANFKIASGFMTGFKIWNNFCSSQCIIHCIFSGINENYKHNTNICYNFYYIYVEYISILANGIEDFSIPHWNIRIYVEMFSCRIFLINCIIILRPLKVLNLFICFMI